MEIDGLEMDSRSEVRRGSYVMGFRRIGISSDPRKDDSRISTAREILARSIIEIQTSRIEISIVCSRSGRKIGNIWVCHIGDGYSPGPIAK